MNVVDSSAWLEYFADGPNAAEFARPIEATRSLLVPTLSLFEVFRRVAEQRDEDDALRAIAVMEQGRVVDLDRATAVAAARLSLELRIAMADGIMLATAQRHSAMFWTQDADFEGVPGVRYFAHHSRRGGSDSP
ncbi:MAG: type II toxin-antitoxin system VapC family toxin [Proteobacteria bacterium]|nr:type II toxin-antitoxin system VapC family toxin [Pseudomonadota bacterium]